METAGAQDFRSAVHLGCDFIGSGVYGRRHVRSEPRSTAVKNISSSVSCAEDGYFTKREVSRVGSKFAVVGLHVSIFHCLGRSLLPSFCRGDDVLSLEAVIVVGEWGKKKTFLGCLGF